MSVELIRDVLRYERIISEGTGQTMVNEDIVIDEMNPEIDNIVSLDGEVISLESVVQEDKVLVEGRIKFNVIYSSKGENVVLKRKNFESTFKHYLQAPMSTSNMSCKVTTGIETLEYEVISSRKVKVNAIINLKTVVFETVEAETIVDLKTNELQSLKDTMGMCELVSKDNVKVIVKGKMEVSQDEVEISDVLKISAHIHKKDVTVQDGKLTVNACVLSRVLFETNSNKLVCQDVETPFTEEVTIEALKPNMKCDVCFNVSEISYEVIENEEGKRRTLEIQMALDISVKTYNQREIEHIVDAYTSKSRFEFEKTTISAVAYFNEGVDSQTVKERMEIDEDLDGIRDIEYVDVKPILTDVKVVDDKVVYDGLLSAYVVYRPNKEEEDIVSYRSEIPFKGAVSLDGARIDMLSDAVANVEYISFDKASQREVDIKAVVEVNVKLYDKMEFEIINNIEEIDIEDELNNMPSLVIYNVQKNDTLWKIAKKYGASVDDIVKLNDIENPDVIMPGMKLLIPKKNFMK